MIHPSTGKDKLLLAILACLPEPALVTAWNLTAEPDSILFDLDDVTYRVDVGGSVEETDGRFASRTSRCRELQDSIGTALAQERFLSDYASPAPGR